jgi:hypothetical protein
VEFLIPILVFGCSEKNDEINEFQSPPKPRMYLIGVDGSGSYEYFTVARKLINTIINRAEPGAIIIARWITSDSYTPKNAIFSARVPNINDNKEMNPFDTRAKAEKLLQQKSILTWKDEIKKQIEETKFPNSNYTDILGFLAIAAEKIHEKTYESAYILLTTDLQNNVNKYEKNLTPKCLEGAIIVVGAYQYEKPEDRKNWQVKFINEWGAKRVIFLAPEETEEIEGLLWVKK